MILKNVQVYTEKKTFEPCEIIVENGLFQETCSEEHTTVIDGKGCYMIPGLIDIHFHGCMGYDFCDGTAEAINALTQYQASVGVTSIVPATMTISSEELGTIMDTAKAHIHTNGAKLVGINMEGPFLNAAKKGAQHDKYIRTCDVAFYRELQKRSGGMIKLVDIAPETEHAISFIKAVKDEVSVSIAHTCADYETARQAFESGANHVTHLYNAMPPFTHRAPGVVGAAFDCGAYVELICDGIHIHPSVVRATMQLFTDDTVVFISDSMRATGLTDGMYTLGGQDVTVKGNLATLTGSDTIAGSVTNLMDCMKIAVTKMGIPLTSAVACATMNPAKSVGIYDTCGSITAGKCADFVLLDTELNIQAVYINGVLVR